PVSRTVIIVGHLARTRLRRPQLSHLRNGDRRIARDPGHGIADSRVAPRGPLSVANAGPHRAAFDSPGATARHVGCSARWRGTDRVRGTATRVVASED